MMIHQSLDHQQNGCFEAHQPTYTTQKLRGRTWTDKNDNNDGTFSPSVSRTHLTALFPLLSRTHLTALFPLLSRTQLKALFPSPVSRTCSSEDWASASISLRTDRASCLPPAPAVGSESPPAWCSEWPRISLAMRLREPTRRKSEKPCSWAAASRVGKCGRGDGRGGSSRGCRGVFLRGGRLPRDEWIGFPLAALSPHRSPLPHLEAYQDLVDRHVGVGGHEHPEGRLAVFLTFQHQLGYLS